MTGRTGDIADLEYLGSLEIPLQPLREQQPIAHASSTVPAARDALAIIHSGTGPMDAARNKDEEIKSSDPRLPIRPALWKPHRLEFNDYGGF